MMCRSPSYLCQLYYRPTCTTVWKLHLYINIPFNTRIFISSQTVVTVVSKLGLILLVRMLLLAVSLSARRPIFTAQYLANACVTMPANIRGTLICELIRYILS